MARLNLLLLGLLVEAGHVLATQAEVQPSQEKKLINRVNYVKSFNCITEQLEMILN